MTMRWFHFIILQCLLVVVVGVIAYLHNDRVIMIKKPPASLAQWYRPENKRQVWLHTMFKLRREMQAVEFYSDNNNTQQLSEWVDSLNKDYLKIADMVPEWNKKLDMDAVDDLQRSVKNNNQQGILIALDKLTESCNACHLDYRAVSAAMYRAPDFSSIEISAPMSFNKHMTELSQQINQIKIASRNGAREAALLSLSNLTQGINTLGKTCSNESCHKKDMRLYPDDNIKNTINRLAETLRVGKFKEQGKELGTLAVLACARCHGTHRIAYDIREVFVSSQNWLQLIKH